MAMRGAAAKRACGVARKLPSLAPSPGRVLLGAQPEHVRSRRSAVCEPRIRSVGTAAPSVDPLLEENEALRRELAALKRQAPGAALSPTETTKFAGVGSAGYMSEPHFWYPHVESPPPTMPCFRILDDLGRVVDDTAASYVPEISRDFALAVMATMVRVSEFDKIFLDAQRQGRISFYMTGRGEEGCTVGSAAALHPTDWVLPQYRELGVCFWRGWKFDEVAHQL